MMFWFALLISAVLYHTTLAMECEQKYNNIGNIILHPNCPYNNTLMRRTVSGDNRRIICQYLTTKFSYNRKQYKSATECQTNHGPCEIAGCSEDNLSCCIGRKRASNNDVLWSPLCEEGYKGKCQICKIHCPGGWELVMKQVDQHWKLSCERNC